MDSMVAQKTGRLVFAMLSWQGMQALGFGA